MAKALNHKTTPDPVELAVREARSKVRIRQFVDAATRVMEKLGFHGMSMQALADEVGVSVGLAYQYFDSKEDVLLAVIVDILESYRREVPAAMEAYKDPIERLAAGFGAYCKVVNDRRAATLLTYRESKTLLLPAREETKELEGKTTSLLADAISLGQQQKLFIDIDPMLVAYDLILIAHMWALKHWHFAKIMTLEQYREQQFAIMLNAVLREAKKPAYQRFLNNIRNS